MKRFVIAIFSLFTLYTTAQIPPIFDYTWKIEQIDTGSQIITADLNPLGEYDTITFNSTGIILDNMTFYELVEVYFGHCQMLFSFDNSNSELFYHQVGCFLSNDDSSQIALYFNDIFIVQNTNALIIDNDFVPFTNGPLSYSFTTAGNTIYLHIANTIGEVATFSANNLSTDLFLEQAISIYPNPVSDKLLIDNELLSIDKVQLFDINGRSIKTFSDQNTNEIDMSELSKGIYIIHIETSVGVLRKKILKE